MTSLPAANDWPSLGVSAQPTQGDLANFITRFLLQRAPEAAPVLHTRQAAVLVPIVCHPVRPTLLLTRRSALLRKHAGQVAFPGGAADATDATLIATALREADEEVSIAPERVTVLGTLPPIDSVSGFQVTPVVGLLPANMPFRPSADEVAELFEMPLQTAFSLARYHPLDIERQQRKHRVYLSWYQQQFVWGLTAAIIRQLAIQVSSPGV